MRICYKCGYMVLSNESFHGLHQHCFRIWFGQTSPIDFTNVSLKRDFDASGQTPTHHHTSFFHGKFKKYSAQLADKSYILKVQQQEYLELPQIEYLSNIIAQRLGLHIPPFYFIRFLNEMDTFVVHNFMDSYKPGNLIHIYHFLQDNDEFSVTTILAIIADKVGRREAIYQFIYACLFDALIGNHDRHGRNIALIETKKGMVLSPLYDNPSYIGLENHGLLLAQHNPKGKVATRSTCEPTIRDYVQEFKNLGYTSVVTSFLARSRRINFDDIIQKPYLSEKRQIAFLVLIKRRMEELENAILA
jgi:hypothetical protein